MWLVKLALRRPYSSSVLAILILMLGALSFLRMPKDIFPPIDIPVISVIWSYSGLPAEDMERRFTTVSERASTTTVNDIEHIESQSLNGVTVIKIYFQPNVKIAESLAQVTSICQTIVRALPPGATPPLIIRYSASNVPVLYYSISGAGFSEQELYDFGLNTIRTQLATVQGASVPLPYGGKARQVTIDLDLAALRARGIAPAEVSAAVNAGNVILPSGTAKIGSTEYSVTLNSSPQLLDQLNDLPVKKVGNDIVYLRDVAHARDGYAVQQNMVHNNGLHASLLTVLKSGQASTLDIIQRVKAKMPSILSTLPKELEVKPLFDQSVFVANALSSVGEETLIAAVLTALMILLFLGSWRSTLIVATSIPLSMCVSLTILYVLGQTINIMTLGGLALAVGILVDDATVEIENIHRNLAMKKPIVQAILDGAMQIATPAFVSTLCICIVFVPVFFLTGVSYYLFSPLATAVVFAMLASYGLSRTVVTTMAHYLLTGHEHEEEGENHGHRNLLERFHYGFIKRFERVQEWYVEGLEWALDHLKLLIFFLVGMITLSVLLCFFAIGRDFFPLVDAGQFRLHVRAPQGTRLEETGRIFAEVEQEIRTLIPASDIDLMTDNIGLPPGGVNLAFSDSATTGSADGEILVSLKEGHQPTWDYVRKIRHDLQTKFPDCVFFIQPSDIVGQILNFGLPAPIDVQVTGRDKGNYDIAVKLAAGIRKIRGAADVHVHQTVRHPALKVNVDRARAELSGLSQRDVAQDVLTILSGSSQTSPNFWVNPQNGVNYQVSVLSPTYRIDSIAALNHMPISSGTHQQELSNLAEIKRDSNADVISHYNVQPTFDIYANVEDRDLAGVSGDVNRIIETARKSLPKGTTIEVRGQVKSMQDSFAGLGFGMIGALALIYLLMVVNFQSWLEPFIIITALPMAFCGIILMLLITGTTISVPALMGMIMSIGIATSNSILVVNFANDEMQDGKNAREAALSAGRTRLRPVLMTALAMLMGMIPMSLGLGDGGEQNAPLGRAVIGGLLFATVSTLFFVPGVYAALMKKHTPGMELDPLLMSQQEKEKQSEHHKDQEATHHA